MNLRSLSVLLGIGMAAISGPATVEAAKWVVNPGESIQAAVDAASPGDKIMVLPGTYVETHGNATAAGLVEKDGIRLMGKVDKKLGEAGKVRLVHDPNGPPSQSGIWARGTELEPLEGFYVRGFTVEGFPHNGIVTYDVNKFKIMKNESIDNHRSGIWSVLSAKGMVKGNVSHGSVLYAALMVEASENVRVLKNELYNNTIGFEITVSKNVKAMKNDIHDNAVGVGLWHGISSFHPNVYGDEMGNWRIGKNHIYNNNRPNLAPPGTVTGDLPIGGGVILLGVDKAVIKSNLIENNDFYGIAVLDYCTAVAVNPPDRRCADPNDPNDPGQLLLSDPVADDNLFQGNELNNNGTNPPDHPMNIFAAEIIFLQGLLVELPHPPEGNCFKKNDLSDPNSVYNFPGDPDTLPTDGC
jgi:parallel beta-helix repeat protein